MTKSPPRLQLASSEARLVLVAALAGTYLVAWAALAPGAPVSRSPEPVPTTAWLDELPPAERAAVAIDLPPGLEVADRAAAAPRPVARPRLRTRSS